MHMSWGCYIINICEQTMSKYQIKRIKRSTNPNLMFSFYYYFPFIYFQFAYTSVMVGLVISHKNGYGVLTPQNSTKQKRIGIINGLITWIDRWVWIGIKKIEWVKSFVSVILPNGDFHKSKLKAPQCLEVYWFSRWEARTIMLKHLI